MKHAGRGVLLTKAVVLSQVDEAWLAMITAVTRICHEPNQHLRNNAALILTG